ncbi:flagellar basal body rod protein FlgB [Accumulibacter sp.]|uniref:flagellar basal body rod protein FlgB n=1 Tax=Accumulibacter sp. TaxID=2053492 RepID=UPI00261E9729|nr:flagellar basal body rod protein FlgB [Accumulibacter sp.]
MVSKLDSALSFQHQALTLRANRQQVLAGNIANADTPNFKARDFDFSAALAKAVDGRGDGTLALTTTSPHHLSGNAESGLASLLYRQPTQAGADGNTVDMDVERAQFSENAMYYEAGMTFLSGQIKTLLTAVQG